MRFSISFTSGTDRAISARDITAFAKNAEALGYYAIYVTDHYYHLHPNFHAVSAAAVLAAATERVKLGFSAYQVPLRHPIAVAKKFTMLDALSEGRMIAGLATGSYDKEFEAFGIPFNKRGKMMDEGLNAIKKLWTEDNVSFSGEFWSFEDVTIKPKPVQQPHLPIWIASWTGGGRPARRVAEHGDGWQSSGLHTPIEQLKPGWEFIEQACGEIDRDPTTIGRAYVNIVTHFAETPDKAWGEFVALSEKNKTRHRELCFLGDTSDIVAKLQELQAAGMEEATFLLGVDDIEKAKIIANDIMPKFQA
jgi:probable F420-dependent oxidoreductase